MPERDDDQQALHAAIRRLLLQPASYPDKPRSIELIETHISCVFVTGALVYKESVVVDGTFLSAELLDHAAAAATTARARLLVIRCQCPDEVARQRIAARLAVGPSLSDARPELYDQQRQELEAVPAELPGIAVDTTLALATQIEIVRRAISAGDSHRPRQQ